MARVIHHPRVSSQEVIEDDASYIERDHTANVAERIVWLIAGVILTLLAFRFVFALLGANPNSGITQFVYNVSHPFVAPFFNLFNYNYVDNGIGRVEIFTIVAMLFYWIVAAIIARFVSINRQ